MPNETDRQVIRLVNMVARWVSLAVIVAGCLLLYRQRANFFVTADQRGQRLLDRGDAADAAEAFANPYRKASAYYRAGDFEQSASWFAGLPTPEAALGQGNALVMQGKYDDAIASYDRALQLRPGWETAIANRDIAVGRAERLDFEGGNMTGGELGADGITFDENASSSDETETITGEQELGDEELRAVWLRQVQTTPSDFLRTKFAYQLSRQQQSPSARSQQPDEEKAR